MNSVPDLAREEWDFSDCPAHEIWECHAYEFAREIQVIRKDVDSLRKNVPRTFEALLNALRPRVERTLRTMALFWYCPEFPDKPYLTIPVEERKRRRRMFQPTTTQWNPFIVTMIPPDIGQRLAAGRILYDSLELALVRIDWLCSDRVLKRAFSDWLKKHRPPDVKALETRGAGNFLRRQINDLKALGAFRLLKVMKWNDAFLLTDTAMGKMWPRSGGGRRVALYADREEVWTKAAQRAETLIFRMSSGLSRLYISKRID